MLWKHIQQTANRSANRVALMGEVKHYSYAELVLSVQRVARQLKGFKNRVVALYLDNCPEWIMLDLACQQAGVTLLPLPNFFSDQQLKHAISQAGASAIIHLPSDRIDTLFGQADSFNVCDRFIVSSTSVNASLLPDDTAKITFTSGSTGEPKGVCLSNQQQFSVASGINNLLNLGVSRHLSLLPFSTLLENVAGVYLTLMAGGTVLALPQNALGFNGSSGFQINDLLSTMDCYQPNSIILLPELLLALVSAIERGWQPPQSLRFIAVGGSKVSEELLNKASQQGLPVYEGYGLSECASVVSLNAPSAAKIGSVGRPLAHVTVAVEDSELVVTGNTFLGYVNEPESWGNSTVRTGDLGYLNDAGYLFVNGRKKNLIISSFARNINPEWVESNVLASGLLQQCVVFGDAKPFCVALVYPAMQASSDDEIQQCLDSVNQTLPDYAQITSWYRLDEPLSVACGLLTPNGRPKREAILQKYSSQLEQLYSDDLLANYC